MHAPGFEKRHPARVRVVERVGRGDAADGFLDRGDALRILGNRRQGLLMVSKLGRIEREKRCEVRSVPGQVEGVHGDIIGWSDLRKQARKLSFSETPRPPGGLELDALVERRLVELQQRVPQLVVVGVSVLVMAFPSIETDQMGANPGIFTLIGIDARRSSASIEGSRNTPQDLREDLVGFGLNIYF